ncbi:Ig-like domain-containing protein [Patescibacteria group bacterium]
MKKYILPILVFFAMSPFVFAGNLSLTKIGALDTTGKDYAEWWYTGTNPTFQGTADAGSTVDITIGEDTMSVTASGDGVWSYATSLDQGDYGVSIKSGEDNISFTLHTGQGLPENFGVTTDTSESTTPVPETGVSYILLSLAAVSFVVFGLYLHLHSRLNLKQAIEQDITESLE